MDWLVLDVPLDSSGAGRGESRAPAALRAAGLLDRLGASEAGVVDAVVRDRTRDPITGMVGAGDVRRATANVAAALRALPREPGAARPLVVGGDCTLLLGVFTAQPAGTALWFVDGHPDFFDGRTSPTGEAADMDLSILTGHGPAGFANDGEAGIGHGGGRLVDPALVDLVGHRLPTDDSSRIEADRIDLDIHGVTAEQVHQRGADNVGAEIAGRGGAPAWLHLDLDVLDAETLPAVTYPQAGGLSWDDLADLTGPMVGSGRLCGVSVADFNPDRDPDGRHARRVVAAVTEVLADAR